MEHALDWIEDHPWLAAAIGLGGVLILLWLLGFFSSSSNSSSSSGTNLAAAYYAAEAAQTTASTQLQMATVAYGAQTAQAQIQANGAEAIAATNANAATTINGQNAGATTVLGNDQLLAAINSNDDALNAANTAASYGYQTAQAGYAAQELSTLSGLIPSEFAQATAGSDAGFYIGGLGTGAVQLGQTQSSIGGPVDPATLAQLSPAQRAAMGYA